MSHLIKPRRNLCINKTDYSQTRLKFVYKMIRGQNDIDINTCLQLHSEFRTRGIHRYRYRQDRSSKVLFFILSTFPIDSWSFLPKTRFLNVLREIFRLDIGQISFNLVKKAFAHFLLLVSRFRRFWLGRAQKSKF